MKPSTHTAGRDRGVVVLRSVKRWLTEAGLGRAFESEAARRARHVLFRVRVAEVISVLVDLEAAGVRCWLSGGWGVDALLGRETRAHTDIDICVDTADGAEVRADAVLRRLGYQVTQNRAASGPMFPSRTVYRDGPGRTIDLIRVRVATDDLPGAKDRSATGVPAFEAGSVTIGHLAGRPVPCISPEVQLAAHRGYSPQRRDRLDVAQICHHFGLDPPPGYEAHRSESSRILEGLGRALGSSARLPRTR